MCVCVGELIMKCVCVYVCVGELIMKSVCVCVGELIMCVCWEPQDGDCPMWPVYEEEGIRATSPFKDDPGP